MFLFRTMILATLLFCTPQWVAAQTWTQYGGDNRFATQMTLPSEEASAITAGWQLEIGEGLSGVVSSGQTIFATSLEPGSSKNQMMESVTALDLATGKEQWKHTYSAGWLKEQEAFGGRTRSPQATPAIIGQRVISIGFTGKILGLDRTQGNVCWQYDAVEDFGATPVQFGFSASPVPMATPSGDRVFLLTGGKSGGLVCLDAENGEKIWNVPCGEASYATPVLLEHPAGKQIVFQDREELIAADTETGKVLWRYRLPKQGLTNVPTPLPVDDNTALIISGQGIGGTKRLDVQWANEKWSVREAWSSRNQFFYCNWIVQGKRLIGCNTKLLVVLNTDTGEILARWRGFSDSNVLGCQNGLMVLDGKGKLTLIQPGTDSWKVSEQYQLCEGRVWTPLATMKNCLIYRVGKNLICSPVQSLANHPKEVLLPLRKTKTSLKLGPSNTTPDFLPQIIAAFEAGGATAAARTYEQIRTRERKKFQLPDRAELLKLAVAQGYLDLARKVAKEAAEDFVDEDLTQLNAAAKQIKPPSKRVNQSEEGLTYVEFAICNRGEDKKDVVVRGPKEHAFGYGIPFPSGKFRIEKWPVGTKLFWSVNDQPGKLILTVSESLAGQTFDLAKKQADK